MSDNDFHRRDCHYHHHHHHTDDQDVSSYVSCSVDSMAMIESIVEWYLVMRHRNGWWYLLLLLLVIQLVPRV